MQINANRHNNNNNNNNNDINNKGAPPLYNQNMLSIDVWLEAFKVGDANFFSTSVDGCIHFQYMNVNLFTSPPHKTVESNNCSVLGREGIAGMQRTGGRSAQVCTCREDRRIGCGADRFLASSSCYFCCCIDL